MSQKNELNDAEKFLTFKISSRLFAFPLKDILEINTSAPFRLNDASSTIVSGFVNFRGQKMQVFNFASGSLAHKSKNLIILKSKSERFAIQVDNIQDIVSLSSDELNSNFKSTLYKRDENIFGVGLHKGKEITILKVGLHLGEVDLSSWDQAEEGSLRAA